MPSIKEIESSNDKIKIRYHSATNKLWEDAVYGLRRIASSKESAYSSLKGNEILSSYHHANISTLDYQVSILNLLNDPIGGQWPVALYLYDEMLSKHQVRLNVMNILFRDLIKIDPTAFELFHGSLFKAAEDLVPEIQIYSNQDEKQSLFLDLHYHASQLSKITLLQAFNKIAASKELQEKDLILVVGRGKHSINQRSLLGDYIQEICERHLPIPLKLRGIRNSKNTGRLIVPADEISKFTSFISRERPSNKDPRGSESFQESTYSLKEKNFSRFEHDNCSQIYPNSCDSESIDSKEIQRINTLRSNIVSP